MRCKRCGKKLSKDGIHTCTPYMYYKGITGTATIDGETFDFIVDSVEKDSLIFIITSGEEEGKFTFLYFNEIDDNIKFNLEN